MKRLPLGFLMLVSVLAIAHSQTEVDVIYLKDGSKIIGTIIELVPSQHVKVRTRDGSEFVFQMERVERIVKEARVETADLSQSSYFELGISIGTPGGLNLAGGRWFGVFGLRISGMQLARNVGGVQLNLGHRLSDNTNRYHALGLLFGTSRIEEEKWSYLGLAYNLVWVDFISKPDSATGTARTRIRNSWRRSGICTGFSNDEFCGQRTTVSRQTKCSSMIA